MPALIGSFATYFGERPLEIRFWDADAERLDLFDRFARLCFTVNKCSHRLVSTDDPKEALDSAGRVVIAVGGNCARKLIGPVDDQGEGLIPAAVATLSCNMSPEAEVLSLVADGADAWPHLDWPAPPSEAERPRPPSPRFAIPARRRVSARVLQNLYLYARQGLAGLQVSGAEFFMLPTKRNEVATRADLFVSGKDLVKLFG